MLNLLEPLIHDWVEHLQQTMKEQEQEQIADATDFAMSFVGRQRESRYFTCDARDEVRDRKR